MSPNQTAIRPPSIERLPQDDRCLGKAFTKGVKIIEWTKGSPRPRSNRYIVRLKVDEKGRPLNLTWCREDPRGKLKALPHSKAMEFMEKYGPQLIPYFPEIEDPAR